MPHQVDVHVGRRLRQRRWMLGVSQSEVAEKVGIKFQQLQKYEVGTNRVSASRLWEIARVLDVPVEYFFVGLEGADQCRGDVPGDLLADKEATAMVRSYYAMPKSQRRRLLDLAQVLAGGASDAVATRDDRAA